MSSLLAKLASGHYKRDLLCSPSLVCLPKRSNKKRRSNQSKLCAVCKKNLKISPKTKKRSVSPAKRQKVSKTRKRKNPKKTKVTKIVTKKVSVKKGGNIAKKGKKTIKKAKKQGTKNHSIIRKSQRKPKPNRKYNF